MYKRALSRLEDAVAREEGAAAVRADREAVQLERTNAVTSAIELQEELRGKLERAVGRAEAAEAARARGRGEASFARGGGRERAARRAARRAGAASGD